MFIFETLDEVRSGTSNKRPVRGSNAACQQCFKTKTPQKSDKFFLQKKKKPPTIKPTIIGAFFVCYSLLQITIYH
jgi:hypothetical protein